MKRLIENILIISMILTLGACGSTKETTKLTNNQEANIQDQQNTDLEEKTNQSLLPYTYQVPLKDIYVDVPNYQEIEGGYTRIFIVHEKKYATFTSAFNYSATDAKDAYSKAFDAFCISMQNYEGGPNSFHIKADKMMTINGIDVYYFEGTINYGEENLYDGYGVGYSFIMDDIPCAIIGSVTDKEQPEELKKEIKEIVAAMMQSVRSEL